MNGLYVYSIVVAGSLLALVITPGLTTGLYSPIQSSVLLTQQNSNPALATPSDDRVFLEKSFDTPQHSGQQPPQPALAYAVPESAVVDNEPPMPQMSDTPGGSGSYGPWSQDQTTAAGLDFNMPGLGGGTTTPNDAAWTAVYDISAHTVYLPDGTNLEAHSGLGSRLDDPRYVREHMRGATPPNVYELALREKTFHGVQALRLKPVGGGNTFGRKGLLAHTYMLGPKGESNGCVVFKNYNVFLQAFQNGQVKRLIVLDNLKVREGYELALAQVSFAPFVHVSYSGDANATAQDGKNLVDGIFHEPLEVPAPPPRPADVDAGRLRLKERGAAALLSASLRRRETHHGRGRSAKIARLIDRRAHASACKTARHRHWHEVPVGILREAARHRHWHDVPVRILREAHR
jgi:Protein of unknown function (DUF2778)